MKKGGSDFMKNVNVQAEMKGDTENVRWIKKRSFLAVIVFVILCVYNTYHSNIYENASLIALFFAFLCDESIKNYRKTSDAIRAVVALFLTVIFIVFHIMGL